MQLKELINPDNIKNFVQGYGNLLKNKYGHLEQYIREQGMLRAYLCSPCLENGRCLVCKCSTPGMFFSPNKIDSNLKWSKMMGEKEWAEFKAEYPQLQVLINSIENDTNNLRHNKELLGTKPKLHTTVQKDLRNGQGRNQVLLNNVVINSDASPNINL